MIAIEEENLAEVVAQITDGKGARVIFDPVGGGYTAVLAQAAAFEGTIYLYGELSGQIPQYPLAAFSKGVSVRGFAMMHMQLPERLSAMKRFIFDGLIGGQLKPQIDRVFNLDQVEQAYRYLESNQQVGKIVIRI